VTDLLTHELEISQNKVDVNIQIGQVLSQVEALEILIPDSEDVRNYLLHFPDIIDLIIPICELVKEKFKHPTQISLEVYHDPEIIDEYITIYVRQYSYERSVMKRIEEIETKYENELIDKEGWVIVTTDFQKPR
jgi:hypothetical protein